MKGSDGQTKQLQEITFVGVHSSIHIMHLIIIVCVCVCVCVHVHVRVCVCVWPHIHCTCSSKPILCNMLGMHIKRTLADEECHEGPN